MEYLEEKNAKKTRVWAMTLTTLVFGAILGYLAYQAMQPSSGIAHPATGNQAMLIYSNPSILVS